MSKPSCTDHMKQDMEADERYELFIRQMKLAVNEIRREIGCKGKKGQQTLDALLGETNQPQ